MSFVLFVSVCHVWVCQHLCIVFIYFATTFSIHVYVLLHTLDMGVTDAMMYIIGNQLSFNVYYIPCEDI